MSGSDVCFRFARRLMPEISEALKFCLQRRHSRSGDSLLSGGFLSPIVTGSILTAFVSESAVFTLPTHPKGCTGLAKGIDAPLNVGTPNRGQQAMLVALGWSKIDQCQNLRRRQLNRGQQAMLVALGMLKISTSQAATIEPWATSDASALGVSPKGAEAECLVLPKQQSTYWKFCHKFGRTFQTTASCSYSISSARLT